MNKKIKFHNVCNEIKKALGKDTSYREILECSQLIINIFDQDEEGKDFFIEEPKTLDQKELYEIWEEEPWTIYFEESMNDQFIDFDWGQIRTQYAI